MAGQTAGRVTRAGLSRRTTRQDEQEAMYDSMENQALSAGFAFKNLCTGCIESRKTQSSAACHRENPIASRRRRKTLQLPNRGTDSRLSLTFKVAKSTET